MRIKMLSPYKGIIEAPDDAHDAEVDAHGGGAGRNWAQELEGRVKTRQGCTLQTPIHEGSWGRS